MKRLSSLLMVGAVLIVMMGCARSQTAQTVQTVPVPPRIDLKQHETIGVLEFSSSSDGKLGPLATRRFAEWARRDQGLVRMVDLGSKARTLRSLGRTRWDPETFIALGRERGVETILTGQLKISDVRPDLRVFASMGSGQISAQVDATLVVELIETSTGASIWSASANGTRSVGQISVFSGKKFAFDAEDPDRAYGEMVDSLVEQVTRDFRVTWQRQ